jgi:hypothetical protein
MTDFQPLLARAVAALDPNTGEGRRGIYDRARQALLNQLRAVTPPLADSDITRERLALEEAIRKIETESAQKNPHMVRANMPRALSAPPVQGGLAPRISPSLTSPPRVAAASSPASRVQAAGAPIERRPAPVISPPVMRSSVPPAAPGEPSPRSAQPPQYREQIPAHANGGHPIREPRPEADYPQASEGRLQDMYEDELPEPGDVPEPARRRSAESERHSHFESNRLPDRARRPAARRSSSEISPEDFAPIARPRAVRKPVAPPQGRESQGKAIRTKIIVTGLIVLFVTIAGLLGYQNRGRILALLDIDRGDSSQVTDDRPKSGERVAPINNAQQRPAPSNVDPAVAQRAVLYEENPGGGQQFQNFVGTAVWRTETVVLGAGRAPDLGLRVDIDIPDRKISIVMNFRRNMDANFPASHTIEIQFNTPGDPFGGVSEMRGVRAKSSETAQGTPLQAAVEKVKEGFFLLALPNSDEESNLSLLRERDWLDIPFVYNNGRRAVLTFQKGTPGERAVNEALQSWGK